jgi:hypothetical protein
MEEGPQIRFMDRVRAIKWFDAAARVVGVAALLISLFCAYVTVALIVDFGDGEPGFVKTIEGYGIGFFAVASIVSFFTGKWFLGEPPEWLRSRRRFGAGAVIRRHQIPSFVRHLASSEAFRTTRSWDERCEVAARLIPALHEAFVGGDWEERMQAESIVRTAWKHCLEEPAR